MKKIDFTQPDGFPFDQSILDFLQDEAILASQSASLAGPLAVMSGCVVAGSNAGNGLVFMNNELLAFVGGAIQPNVVIVETVSTLNYIDTGAPKGVVKARYATFGNDGTNVNLWSDFKKNTSEGVLARLDRLERIAAPFMPMVDGTGTQVLNGGMLLWKKAANLVPAGWAEVVDWRGRLPMGYDPTDTDFNTVHDSFGGSKTRTLGATNMPSGVRVGGSVTTFRETIDTGNAVKDTTPGAGQSFSLLNPFRIVMFIEYIGI